MRGQLSINIVQAGQNVEIGLLQGGQVLIGREPDDGGIVVPNQAVSRNHGVFVRFRNHWFYKDLGSTNGSWVNGTQATEGVWKLIRGGDVLQLADAAISVTDKSDSSPTQKVSGFPALGGVSLLVFSKGEFLDEYPVPDYGRALVLGGSQGDLQIEGQLIEQPSLVVERRSMNICAYAVAKSIKTSINDNDLGSAVNLKDLDELKVAHYFIIFNNPTQPSRVSNLGRAPLAQESQQDGTLSGGGGWKDWGDSNSGPDLLADRGSEYDSSHGAPLGRGIFGRSQTEGGVNMEETIAIDPSQVEEKVAGYEMHPSMRYVVEEPVYESMGSLDEKIIFFIGILLLLGLVGLMAYWIFA